MHYKNYITHGFSHANKNQKHVFLPQNIFKRILI
jgi:hypothetical protein